MGNPMSKGYWERFCSKKPESIQRTFTREEREDCPLTVAVDVSKRLIEIRVEDGADKISMTLTADTALAFAEQLQEALRVLMKGSGR